MMKKKVRVPFPDGKTGCAVQKPSNEVVFSAAALTKHNKRPVADTDASVIDSDAYYEVEYTQNKAARLESIATLKFLRREKMDYTAELVRECESINTTQLAPTPAAVKKDLPLGIIGVRKVNIHPNDKENYDAVEFDVNIASFFQDSASSSSSLVPSEAAADASARVERYETTVSKPGYASSTWTFRVGGLAGDDNCPVGARFTNSPFAHYAVDDMGCVDHQFWTSLLQFANKANSCKKERNVYYSLFEIMMGVVAMLLGPYPMPAFEGGTIDGGTTYSHVGGGADRSSSSSRDTDERYDRWQAAQTHTAAKIRAILAYKQVALRPSIIGLGSDVAASSLDNGSSIEPSATRKNCEAFVNSGLTPLFIKLMTFVNNRTQNSSSSESMESDSRKMSDSGLIVEHSRGIYSMELFTHEFCNQLVSEIDCYENSGLPRRRPNTMNNYGLIMSEIGLQMLSDYIMKLMVPIVEYLFPEEAVSYGIDHHHSFIVQYKSDRRLGDRGLDMHHDASEVTLNVCLGRDNFKGGDLLFCGEAGSSTHRKYLYSLAHVKGRAVIHLGRHRHGAENIEQVVVVTSLNNSGSSSSSRSSSNNSSGCGGENSYSSTSKEEEEEEEEDGVKLRTIEQTERLNLIMWFRSTSFRSAAAFGHIAPDGFPRLSEHGPPDRCCLSEFNDDDYDKQMKIFMIKDTPVSLT